MRVRVCACARACVCVCVCVYILVGSRVSACACACSRARGRRGARVIAGVLPPTLFCFYSLRVRGKGLGGKEEGGNLVGKARHAKVSLLGGRRVLHSSRFMRVVAARRCGVFDTSNRRTMKMLFFFFHLNKGRKARVRL